MPPLQTQSPPGKEKEVINADSEPVANSYEREIVPPLLRSPSLDDVSFWNRYVSFGCAFQVLWFAVGLPRPMRSSELWDPPTEDKIETLAAAFDKAFNDPKFTYRPDGQPYPYPRYRYLSALWNGCKVPLLIGSFFMLVSATCEIATPFLINYLIVAIQNRDFDGLYYALGILFCLLALTIGQQQQIRFSELALNRCRSVTNFVLFRKAMRIRSYVGVVSTDISSITSQDTQRFIDIAPFFQVLWAAPVQVIVGGALLYYFLGPVGLFALAVLLLLFPLIFIIGIFQVVARSNYSKANSLRLLLISEFLQGVNVVKMYGWEPFVKERVLAAREDEMRATRTELLSWSLMHMNIISYSLLTAALAFLLYIHIEGRLTTADAFSAFTLLMILKFPILYFGGALMTALQLFVGCARISEILCKGTGDQFVQSHPEEETNNQHLPHVSSDSSPHRDEDEGHLEVAMASVAISFLPTPVALKEAALVMNDISATWKAPSETIGDPTFALRHVNLTVKVGEVCAVTGVVGAGKSMLCLTALGETHIASGSCSVARNGPAGTVAYCSQEAFLLSGTIRDNITFHEPFDQQRYLEVLEVCCLWPDLDQYEDGEMTIVGERGITLSGGQKARIALGRAVYAKNVSLMVIDDPFSALDAGTTKKISSSLLSRKHGYLRDRAVLLVTHNRQIVTRYADHVLQMDDGTTRNLNDVNEIDKVLEKVDKSYEEAKAEAPCEAADDADVLLANTSGNSPQKVSSPYSGDEKEDADDAQEGTFTAAQREHIDAKRTLLTNFSKNQLIESEDYEPLVSLKAYATFFEQSGGYWNVLIVIFFLLIERAIFISCDYWLSQWTTASDSPNQPDTWIADKYGFSAAWTFDQSYWYWKVYMVMVAISFVLGFNRLYFVARLGEKTAKNLFENAFVSMLRCPMSFFDSTPSGRIINRFSHDTDRVAYPLTTTMNGVFAVQGWLFSAVIVCAVIMPYTLLVSLPGVVLVLLLAYIFRPINTQLQRLDAHSRSTLQDHVQESLFGAVVLRAFGKTGIVLARSSSLVDENTRTLFAVTLTQRWAALRADLIGSVIGGIIAIFLWIVRDSLNPGLAGMAISWGIGLSRSSGFAVTEGVQADARLVSMDRLCEFRESLKEEPSLNCGINKIESQGNKIEDALPQPDRDHWPTEGRIDFRDVQMRYRPNMPLVLSGATFTVPAGHRVGVIGRTGSGKSSLVQCLFRLRELEGGGIFIDGLDIASVGLEAVRGSRMSIIPQDPVLFCGTVRSNVDPFDKYTDAEVENALRAVSLWPRVEREGGLAAVVAERGNNFSVGQKQLVCIARAVLRKPTILVMDEATANVDHETDELIQKKVRELFAQTTIFEIAHRLHTVADADMIVVMDKGVVGEIGTPDQLLAGPESHFSQLVEASGPAVAAELRQIVAAAAVERGAK